MVKSRNALRKEEQINIDTCFVYIYFNFYLHYGALY